MVNLLSLREIGLPELTSFHQRVLDKYQFQNWEYQGWIVVPGADYLGFKRGSEKSTLTAKLIFQKQFDDSVKVRFAGVVVTPECETIDAVVIDDPYKFQVRRWIYGRVSCYLEGSTNNPEILNVFQQYRK